MQKGLKRVTKIIAVLLTVITLFGTFSVATPVFAEEYAENRERREYFDSVLSGYLKNIVDVDGAVKIKEKEESESTEGKDGIDVTVLTLLLENGAETAYVFSEPICFWGSDGKVVYKDTNINKISDEKLLSEGFLYENGDNDYKMYFSEKSGKGVKLSLPNGEEIGISLGEKSKAEGKYVTETAEKSKIDGFVYENAYGDGTNIYFYPQLNGIKDEIVLDKYNGKSEFELLLHTGKNTAAINCFGQIEIIEPQTKEIIETFAAPFAYDSLGETDPSSEHYADCKYELNKIKDGEYSLKVKVPVEFLTAKTTKYPVTVDPTTSNSDTTIDTAIYSSYKTSPQNNNITACVGKSSQYGYGRALFYFPLPSGLKNYASISSAKFWVRETTARTDSIYVRPYVAKDTWTNSTTWSTKPAYYNGTATYLGSGSYNLDRKNINSASTDSANSNLWYGFDIAKAVKSWTTGTSNKGLVFVSENESSSAAYQWRAFATKEHTTSSYRPYAVITYTNDETKPTVTGVAKSSTSYTKNDVTLTVSATDNVYGTAGIAAYSFDNGSTWQTSNKKTFSGNKTVKIKVKDKANNISDAETVTISNIDKTSPAATITLSPTGDTYGTVTATINITDNVGLKSYVLDGAGEVNISGTLRTVTKTYSQNGTVSVKVTDIAGNSKTVTKRISNIINENSDLTAPETPDIFEENGKIYISSRSFDFDGETDSPETVQYKIGGGNWTEYSEPLCIVNTENVTVYARVIDGAGLTSGTASFVKRANVGEYAVSFDDIPTASNVLPVGFTRNYSSFDGWSFSFNANLAPITNGYVYTDFDGVKHYYILNGENKYLCEDGTELIIESGEIYGVAYTKYIESDILKIYFDGNGKLVCTESDGLYSTYAWGTSSLVITDKTGGVATAMFSGEKPVSINYVRGNSAVTVSYTWSGDRLTEFTDAVNHTETYSYTNNLLTGIGNATVDYTGGANPRVKRVTGADGSFVKYTYDDTAPSDEGATPGNIGKVTVTDSKGVTDTIRYSDEFGFTTGGESGNYSENAVYAPEAINNGLTVDTISFVYYEIEFAPEEQDPSEESDNEGDGDGTESEESRETEYIQNADGTYTFFKYNENEQLEYEITVPESAVTDADTMTVEEALAVATVKTEYSYSETVKDAVHTYSVSKKYDAWIQIYEEDYEYNGCGSIISKTVSSKETSNDGETVFESVDKTEYDYDVWNNCILTVCHAETGEEFRVTTQYDAMGRQISVSAAEETVTTQYDGDGNIVSNTDINGTVSYVYSNGLLLSKTYQDGTVATYVYDSFGNLSSHAYNGYGFTYNTLGSILEARTGTQTLVTYTYSNDINQNVLLAHFGNNQTVEYLRNGDDITSVIYNGNPLYNYSYTSSENEEIIEINDTVNSLTKILEDSRLTVKDGNNAVLYSIETCEKDENVTDSFDGDTVTVNGTRYKHEQTENADIFSTDATVDFTKNYSYNNNKELLESSVGNTTVSYGYNADGNINSVTNAMNGVTKTYSYAYDSKGNVTTEMLTTTSHDELGATVQDTTFTYYNYDNNSQLISVQTESDLWEYEYDSRGNITRKTHYTAEQNGDQTVFELVLDVGFVYDKVWGDKLVNLVNREDTSEGDSLEYDEIGNWINLNNYNYFTWTMGRQMETLNGDSVVCTYNEDGIRTSKTADGITTKFYLDGSKVVYQTNRRYDLYFFYDKNDEIIGFKYQDNNYFYVKNAFGVITDITDENGNIVVSYSYDPWGVITDIEGDFDLGYRINPFRYKSYYYDYEIQWYYLQSRYYFPDFCRFINCDDVNYIGINETEISYNPFAYCENEPVKNSDPNGYLGIVAAMAIGAFFALLVQYIIDVIINIIERKNNILRPITSVNDYILTALSGAASATGMGKWASIIWGAIFSNLSYLSRCLSTGRSPNLLGFAFATLVGIACGLISGEGANLKKMSAISKTSKTHLKTAKSLVKISNYKNKIRNVKISCITSAIRYIVSVALSNLTPPVRNFLNRYIRL